MTTYTWSAKNRAGQRVVKQVKGETAEEAGAKLATEGYTELKLEEGDIFAAVSAGFSPRRLFLGEEIKVTAEQRLKARENPTTGFWSALSEGMKETKGFILIMVFLGAYYGYRGNWISLSLVALGILAWFAFLIFLRSTSVYYKKLIRAADWYQWKEVLSLVETLKTVGRFGIAKIPETELIRHRAKALAGTGHLSEALALYKTCEGRPDCPSWLYKLFIGSIYATAKQYDLAIQWNLESAKEKPGSVPWLDLAYRYARYKHDPVKARAALAEAKNYVLTETALPFKLRCQGVIAYLEGEYATARQDLEKAIEMVEKMKWRPYRDGHLSVARAYLACVLAKLGDLSAASQNFSAAKDYLVATGEDELIAECRRLVGGED